jgi:glycosyltransferase involved in cell wall biosynthesis
MIVTAIRNEGSVGIERYVRHLADALDARGVEYLPSDRPQTANHWHLANSSRGAIVQAPRQRRPYVVTVHDIEPRTRLLLPAYRRFVYPMVVAHAARVVVHSAFAADLLRRHIDLPPSRVEVVPHAAPVPRVRDRAAARELLAWPAAIPTAVLPGAARSVKLVREAIDAAAGAEWRLVLVGEPRDRELLRHARESGVTVLQSPSDSTYEAAIAAADVVLVLRRGTVGETNGPLLDALGAGRAVLATPTGSIPEVAGDAAFYCDPTTESIRDGLRRLLDEPLRGELEQVSRTRGAALDWQSAADAHRHVFDEVFR